MKRPGRLVALGIGAFLLLLIVTLPAQLVFSRLESFGITATGVSGSVWKGQAAAVRSGTIALGRLTWDLHILRLLTGQASAAITLQNSDAFAAGDVGAGLDGRVHLNDFSASWPLAALAGAGLPGGWAGTLNLRLDALTLDNGVPVDIEGTVETLNLTGPARRPANLGSYRATFPLAGAAAADESVTGALQDIEGPLQINGTIRLGPGRSYTLDGQIATRPGAPAEVVNALQYLGEPDAEGRRPFSLAGTF